MNLLAFDTATSGCSAAALRDGALAASQARAMTRGQSESLMPMIDDVLAAAGLTYGDLDALAVTVGPGAFTGLRIGLAAARGLALALNIPCAAVTTLEAVAKAQPPLPDRVADGAAGLLVALDSKREDLYVQLFDRDLAPMTDPAAVMPDALAGLLPGGGAISVAGDAAGTACDALAAAGIAAHATGGPGVPDAVVVGEIAIGRDLPPVGQAPGPIYLRPPDAVRPKDGGRLRP
ncbi:MAG TPA: tRNA (adenosine(37)-N6)-threonylcarbamoyltransferase complex dimerization subunit type 1 TsaB [Rhodospirillaceae bacterium]|nr:tRNA (adenosine(37)-N6)-threonylcarbamoyltransferase complex dimerization subunit type 1 TsaB [Rhodospirillaceae bacterium]